jgi:hypothetical protein
LTQQARDKTADAAVIQIQQDQREQIQAQLHLLTAQSLHCQGLAVLAVAAVEDVTLISQVKTSLVVLEAPLQVEAAVQVLVALV